MDNYHRLLQDVLSRGTRQPNRTGVDTLSLPGAMLQYDLRDGFPAVTTKQLFFKSVVAELLGFFRGAQSAADFRALGTKIWDANANENAAWLANPNRRGQDDLGRIYSAQWTDWRDWREARDDATVAQLHLRGYETIAVDPARGVTILRRGLNQLEDALSRLITQPTDRRIIINAWRPDEFDQAALPPCHVLYQFLANTKSRELHLCVYQRSCDLALGVPFNIASSSLLLSIMARLSGFEAATHTHFLGDAHIYVSHLDGVREQLTREPFAAPRLQLSDRVLPAALDNVRGAFERIEPEDISLVGYQHHPRIDLPMAV